jgi:head-tail adaptor
MIGPTVVMILQRVTKTADGIGGFTEDWSDLRYVTGVLVGLRGEERIITEKETTEADYRFFCDYPIGTVFGEGDRFKYNDGSTTRFFDMLNVMDKNSQKSQNHIDLKEHR